MKNIRIGIVLLVAMVSVAFMAKERKVVKIYLIGDSTVADYTLEKDYQTKRHPLAGWEQVFQTFVSGVNLKQLKHLIKADSALVDDRAKGGRSTRTFFEEGRWAEVYGLLKKNDLVLMQFGHNDASVEKTERYVNINGYKEYLRLFVNQSRQKGAKPIILTPVARNYPWKNGKLENVHGDYPQAAKDVARELNVPLIDLNEMSMESFSAKGQEYVTNNYFMNFGKGLYEAYPEGQKDNTHFQPEGAREVARLVFEGLKKLK